MAQLDAPEADWGSVIYGNTNVNQNSGIAIGKDGVSYWLNNVGTTSTDKDIYLNSNSIATGEEYSSGNSATGNLALLALNPDGTEKWLIHSTLGDFASSQGRVTVDSDGNVIFTAKVRHGDFTGQPITIYDAADNKIEMGGAVEKKSYNLLVAKANSEGVILWHRYITLSTVPANSAQDFVSDAFKTTALTTDDDGNIYVGGNYSAEMTVGDVTLPALNIGDTGVDAQKSTGSIFVLKFNAAGDCLANAYGAQGVTQSVMTGLEYTDGKIYFCGTVTGGADNTPFSFGGKTVTACTRQSLIFGQLNSDLSVEWMKALKSEAVKNSCIIQNFDLSVVNNTLWIAGMGNGKFIDPENTDNYVASVSGSPREGMIFKLSAIDGSWIAGTTSKATTWSQTAANTSLTAYSKILQNPDNPEKCYAYGYVMNNAIGIVLREYDAETLVANVDRSWSLITAGGVPSCSSIAYDATGNTAFVAGRGNNSFKVGADIETMKGTSGWYTVMARFEMPDALKSGISDIVVPSGEDKAEYFNLQGIRVANPAGGIFIRRCGNKVEKVILK